MDENARRRSRRAPMATIGDSVWLVAVAEGASRDAGGLPLELFGEYLPVLVDAAIELDLVGPRHAAVAIFGPTLQRAPCR
jgi:hypothetical protein